MQFKDGSQFLINFDLILQILNILFKQGERFQKSFFKYDIFYAISHLLQNINKSLITYDLYTGFFNMIEMISYDNLQLQLFDTILMNIDIWSRSKIEHQKNIFKHWNDTLYPSFMPIIDKIRPTEWFLLIMSCYYYDFSISKNKVYADCRNLIIEIAKQSLNSTAPEVKTSKIIQLICSKESSFIEKSDMLAFLSIILQKREANFDTNILSNQLIPFLFKNCTLPYTNDAIINQILTLFLNIYKIPEFEKEKPLNKLIQHLILLLHINRKYIIQEDSFLNFISLVNQDGIVEYLPILCINSLLGGPKYLNHLLTKLNLNSDLHLSKQTAVYPIFLLFAYYNQTDFYSDIMNFVVGMFKNDLDILISSIDVIGYSCFNINIFENIKHDVLCKIANDIIHQTNDAFYLISIIKDFIFYRHMDSNSSIFAFIEPEEIMDLDNNEENNSSTNVTINDQIDQDIIIKIKNLSDIISNKTFEFKFGLRINDISLDWLDLDLAKECFRLFREKNVVQYTEFICILTRFIFKYDDEFGNNAKFYLQSSYSEFNSYLDENITSINDFTKIEKILMNHDEKISCNLYELANDFIDFFNANLLFSNESNSNHELVINEFITQNIENRNKCKNIWNILWDLLKSRSFYRNDRKYSIDYSICYSYIPYKIKKNNDFSHSFNIKSISQGENYIISSLDCKLVTIKGEKDCIIFLDDIHSTIILVYENKIKRIPSFEIDYIYYAYKHHKYSGFQIFTKHRKQYFMTFENNIFRCILWKIRCSFMVNIEKIQTLYSQNLLKYTNLIDDWQNGRISNFEYLMKLNIYSGRTFNIAEQYPIFPWVICDFSSSTLDFNNDQIYRDLSKPIGSLDYNRESHTMYYSNQISIFNFLIRLEPFSSQLVNNNVDEGDSQSPIFESIADSYKLATTSKDCITELIPEFFFLPEFLKNNNNIDLGISKNGKINDVILPPWANNSAIQFIYLHRKALESDYVSKHLSEWIDLIWGYKQDGEEAIKAGNIFPIELYESIWRNPGIDKKIIKEIQQFYGQVPLKLFKEKHPNKKFLINSFIPKSSIPSFSDKISSISFSDYMNLISEENNHVFYFNIKFSDNNLIISADVALDLNNHTFGFTLIDQEGLIYIYRVDFSLFNFKCFNVPCQIKKRIKKGISTKKIDREYKIKSEKINKVVFLGSDLFSFVDNKFLCLIVNCKTGNIENIIENDFEIVSIGTHSTGLLGISTNDSVISVYDINNDIDPRVLSIGKEPIKCISFNPKLGILVCGTKDNCILFISLHMNKIRVDRLIKVNGSPQGIIITDSFGFVVVSVTKFKNEKLYEKLILYNINGEKIRSFELENGKRINAITKASSVPGNFDFLILADNENNIFVFEAFYMKVGKPILKCKSKVIKLTYIMDEYLIIAFCENGSVSVIYYPIIS